MSKINSLTDKENLQATPGHRLARKPEEDRFQNVASPLRWPKTSAKKQHGQSKAHCLTEIKNVMLRTSELDREDSPSKCPFKVQSQMAGLKSPSKSTNTARSIDRYKSIAFNYNKLCAMNESEEIKNLEKTIRKDKALHCKEEALLKQQVELLAL